MSLFGIVYRVTNLVNEKCYIGITIRSLKVRWQEHCSPKSECQALSRAIRKYGKEHFNIEEIASSWTQDDLLSLETLLIQQENTCVPNGYNLNEGGRGCLNPSEETRDKFRAHARSYRHSPEARAKISASNKGKIITPEVRARMSETRKGRPAPPGAIARLAMINTGRKRSLETRTKISAKQIGRPMSLVTREKIGSANRERLHSRMVMIGRRFGRLMVLGDSSAPPDSRQKKRIFYLCVCDCGETKIAQAESLRCGDTASCGCLRRETAAKSVGRARTFKAKA